MRARRGASGAAVRLRRVYLESERGELFAHRFGASPTILAAPAQQRRQLFRVGIDEVGEEMTLATLELDANLDAGHGANARRFGGAAKRGNSFEGVVIGDGERGESASCGFFRQRGGIEASVGKNGVRVKIGATGSVNDTSP
jgi:hypothetical protein